MSRKEELKGITVKLSSEKSEDFFHTALCNGLSEISGYGLEVVYKESEYKKAKETLSEKIKNGVVPIGMYVSGNEKLKDKDICYEDVLMEMLRSGFELKLADLNGGDANKITLSTVHKRVEKTDLRHLIEYINDTGGDAITADVILQTVFLGEVVYG